MNIYVISQDENDGYDTFDSAVVAAKNEDEARHIQPSDWGGVDAWALSKNVKVQLIGTAVSGTQAGVILASFNAG